MTWRKVKGMLWRWLHRNDYKKSVKNYPPTPRGLDLRTWYKCRVLVCMNPITGELRVYTPRNRDIALAMAKSHRWLYGPGYWYTYENWDPTSESSREIIEP